MTQARDPFERYEMSGWALRALAYAVQAASEIESGTDAVPALSAAEACVQADMSELSEDDMMDLGGPEMHELPEWMEAQAGFRQQFYGWKDGVEPDPPGE